MAEKRKELIRLTEKFVTAFNKMDLNEVADSFAENSIYEDSKGNRFYGKLEIKKAFEPLLSGQMGQIHFEGDDIFVEEESGKVMTSWTLSIDLKGNKSKIKGLDLLKFVNGKVLEKIAYRKQN